MRDDQPISLSDQRLNAEQRALRLHPAQSENPAYVRSCTDTSEYKSLGFFIVEHFPFSQSPHNLR